MKKLILIALTVVMGTVQQARSEAFNAEKFAREYFAAWTATQMPAATKEDLEHYLSFLVEDVGHQHLPYDNDDSRHPDGKQSIREGMTHYLGKHIEYEAQLLSISYGLNAVAVQFNVSAKGKRGPDEPIESMNYNTMEVLEIEDGKVSMIRKYN